MVAVWDGDCNDLGANPPIKAVYSRDCDFMVAMGVGDGRRDGRALCAWREQLARRRARIVAVLWLRCVNAVDSSREVWGASREAVDCEGIYGPLGVPRCDRNMATGWILDRKATL